MANLVTLLQGIESALGGAIAVAINTVSSDVRDVNSTTWEVKSSVDAAAAAAAADAETRATIDAAAAEAAQNALNQVAVDLATKEAIDAAAAEAEADAAAAKAAADQTALATTDLATTLPGNLSGINTSLSQLKAPATTLATSPTVPIPTIHFSGATTPAPSGTSAAVPQMADVNAMKWYGGVTPGMTFDQMAALAPQSSPRLHLLHPAALAGPGIHTRLRQCRTLIL
jgi:hypothetical protein